MSSVSRVVIAFAFSIAGSRSAQALPFVLDFDTLASEELVTNQYVGLTFVNAIALTALVSLNELDFPPRSGDNVAGNDSGPITISFAAPVLGFGGYFTYTTTLTLTAFDSLNNPVGSTTSAFASNLALDPGAIPNEFLSLTHLAGISSVTISGASPGDSFTLDDATIELLAAAEVPEPATLWLIALGVGALLSRRARKSAKAREAAQL